MTNLNFILIAIFIFISGCYSRSSDLYGPPKKIDPPRSSIEKTFDVLESEVTSEQIAYKQNMITVLFEAKQGEESINNLKAENLSVFENKLPVSNFKLEAQSERTQQVVDIVFLVDITGTMKEFIDQAKKRLIEFVTTSKKRGYHTRMCISTFGDWTVKNCDRFFDTSEEAQVKGLLSELAKLQAHQGDGQDPGWPDLDENPMGALVDLANYTTTRHLWAADSQRFVILVTDWGFLYSPDNQGDNFKANNSNMTKPPPTMAEVTAAIQESQMKIFAVTRTRHQHQYLNKPDKCDKRQEGSTCVRTLVWNGYNTPFQGQPSIVESSGGEYFNFDDVMKGEYKDPSTQEIKKISLDTILDRILLRVKSTYKLTYVAGGQDNPNLASSLPLANRQVDIKIQNNSSAQVNIISKTSTMPHGYPDPLSTWKVVDDDIDEKSLKVFINEREVAPSAYSLKGGDVTFNRPLPSAGSKLKFLFQFKDVAKNIRAEDVFFENMSLDRGTTKVYLNGQVAQENRDFFYQNEDGNTVIQLAPSVFLSEDPFHIKEKGYLKARVDFDLPSSQNK